MLKKWLCLVLALALCFGALPAAMAEDVIITEELEGDAMPDELEPDLVFAQTEDVEASGQGEPAEPEASPSDEGEVPGQSFPAYWRVTAEEAPLFADGTSETPIAVLARDGVVLATERAGARLGVAFNSERGVVTGCVAEDALTALTEDEVSAFLGGIAASESVALYQDNIDLPLPAPACAFRDAAVEEEAGESSAKEDPDVPASEDNPELTVSEDNPELTVSEETPEVSASEDSEPAEPTGVGEPATDGETTGEGETAAKELAEISLAATSVTIGIKQKYDLKPVFLAADGTELKDVTYTVSTSNKKKATVSKKAVVQGKKKGTVTITVTAANGVKATCKVKVVKAPSKVTLSPKKPKISVGQTIKLKAKFSSGTMASCTYTSKNKSVAVVNNEGYVTGLKVGSAVIKVRTHNGKTASVTVKVTKGPQFLSLNGDYELEYDELTESYKVVYVKTLNVGKTFQITCQNEYDTVGAIAGYESDDVDVASVSDGGLVTANEPGTANITVRASNGTEAYLRVTVPGTLPEKIAFASTAASAYVGRTTPAPSLKGKNIQASVLAAAQYESGDAQVFTVAWDEAESRWMLTGVKPGTAKLIATAGSARAEIEVTVSEMGAGTAIRFENDLVYMKVGSAFTPLVLDEYDRPVSASLASDNVAVVSVDAAGALTAVAEGSAVITATGGTLKATMTVVVKAGDATVTLDADSLALGIGERRTLKAKVNGDGASAKLTYASSKPSVATVTASGMVIARAVGQATITVTESGGASATCQVTVSAAPSHLSVSPASICERLKVGGAQLKWSFGAPDEVGTVTFESSDESVASVDGTGYVTFVAVGAAKVTVTTNNGLTATVSVTVLPDKTITDVTSYRLFAAYSYYDSLPFTKRNAQTMATVFGKSKIGKNSYSTKVIGNPSKTQLLSGISKFFAEADDNDVSIIYLCSHGHDNTGSYSNYRMSLPGYSSNKSNANYYITSKEIFNCLKRIRGDVILIIDSCYSGAFIEDMSSKLKDEGGRIAVLTAASNTRATYYNKKKKSVDFFTFFLLQGLGYDEKEGWWNKNAKGKKGSYPGYLAADKAGNNDGVVTLGEFYNYAKNCIDVNIPNYMKKSWYWGDKKKVQKTRFYAGDLKNLPIYQPK